MKTSFPDTALTPVNRQAAKLLAGAEPDQINESRFKLELQKECDDLAASITSMEAQLAAYQGEPNQWFRQCSYNLNVAVKKLKTNRHTITMLTRMAAEIAANKAAIAKAEAQTAKAQAQMVEAQQAAKKQEEISKRLQEQQRVSLARAITKTERHAITMNEDLVFFKAFRRVTKETYGLEAHMSLIKKAEALISSGWKPN